MARLSAPREAVTTSVSETPPICSVTSLRDVFGRAGDIRRVVGEAVAPHAQFEWSAPWALRSDTGRRHRSWLAARMRPATTVSTSALAITAAGGVLDGAADRHAQCPAREGWSGDQNELTRGTARRTHEPARTEDVQAMSVSFRRPSRRTCRSGQGEGTGAGERSPGLRIVVRRRLLWCGDERPCSVCLPVRRVLRTRRHSDICDQTSPLTVAGPRGRFTHFPVHPAMSVVNFSIVGIRRPAHSYTLVTHRRREDIPAQSSESSRTACVVSNPSLARLIVGLYVLVVSVTGAALVFRIDMQRAMFPHLFYPRVEGVPAEPAAAPRVGERAYPGHRISGIDAPTTARPTVLAYVVRGREFLTVLVDPSMRRCSASCRIAHSSERCRTCISICWLAESVVS